MDTEFYQTIEDYLLDKLNADEKAAVEQRITNDPEYADTVKAFRLALKSIDLAGSYRLEERIKMLEGELRQQGFFISEDDILAYFDQDVSDEIQQQIETRLKTDNAFAEKVETLRLVHLEIDRTGQADLVEKIKREAEQLEKEGYFSPQATARKPKAKIRNINWYRSAAVAAVVLILGLVATYFVLQPNPQQLSTAYLHPLEDRISPKLEGNFTPIVDLQDTLEMAINSFNDERYETAQELFQLYLNESQADPVFHPLAQLYRAQSLLLQNKSLDTARDLLLPLAQNDSFDFQSDGIWYLSHYYLQVDNPTAAANYLQQLTDHPEYGTMATEILRKL